MAVIDKIDTHRPVAPSPEIVRPRINTSIEGETAHIKLPISKMATDARKTTFGGVKTRILPKSNMNAA